MFRAVKYEYTDDIEREFMMKRQLALGKNREKELFGAIENEIGALTLPGTEAQTMDDIETGKKGKKGKKQHIEDDSFGINDRVFVCMGRLKETGQPHAWVMTINRTYDEITFWESNRPKKFTLPGRILEDQEKLL